MALVCQSLWTCKCYKHTRPIFCHHALLRAERKAAGGRTRDPGIRFSEKGRRKEKQQFLGCSRGGCVPNNFLWNPEVNLLRQAADG